MTDLVERLRDAATRTAVEAADEIEALRTVVQAEITERKEAADEIRAMRKERLEYHNKNQLLENEAYMNSATLQAQRDEITRLQDSNNAWAKQAVINSDEITKLQGYKESAEILAAESTKLRAALTAVAEFYGWADGPLGEVGNKVRDALRGRA